MMPTANCRDEWDKIPDDEPVFIVRAKDLLSCEIVKRWIDAALRCEVNPAKVNSAATRFREITAFQEQHPDRCKIPD